ncbi:DUF1624 domain-containing protein [Sphingomonas ginsenosidivorax]|uniref:DUF1624 domain-containing protein n=1 Tax=Sphingomonas ginsenosidivorax TaxID=862135 RepID=A0A5C6UEF1_9SPHN|nr:heparan-alpha-glucosaminide N-acetyltransferase domain-containing protein [Sphingomonas ginsenosidivorax]TXC71143.1 DUF1624 domain-containing protein [Sphingomonas ginsenosidivorax]
MAGATTPHTRLQSIDALRGLAMVLMLLDHLRETWLVLVPMPDPVDPRTVLPAMAVARFVASFCAPVFVALTGVAACLFGVGHTPRETASFLVRRGLLLMAIDLLYLSPLYWGVAPQPTFWLQVIWCLGLCMILLAGAIRLPRGARIALGLVLVCGHNLLDPIRLQPGDALFPAWALLHQRDVIALPFGFVAKTTYPILPWMGVMLLGHAIGPWFGRDVDPVVRRRRLVGLGVGMIAAFLVLRAFNLYGDAPWSVVDGSALRTVIGFVSMTKYPPSLLFLLPTLGGGALLLALFERRGQSRAIRALAVFGGAPMFFYLLHLTVLRLLYHGALAWWGPTHGTVFMVGDYGWVLAWYGALILPLYLPTAWFSRLKQRRRDIAWLRFF